MNDSPRVSVVTTFLNGEAFLAEAIESVLDQSFHSWELLLVDDGSRAPARGIAERYAAEHPDRVRLLEHPGHENRGTSASRNLGIRQARGELIAFLDADDAYYPDALEHLVGQMDAHPEVGMCFAGVRNWHGWTGKPADQARDLAPDTGIEAGSVLPCNRLLELILDRTVLSPWPSAMMVRRVAAQRIGCFEEAFRGMYDDQVFVAKLSVAGPLLFTGGITTNYRQHADSMYTRARASGKRLYWRRYFLEWLLPFLKAEGLADAPVGVAAQREMRALEQAEREASTFRKKARRVLMSSPLGRLLELLRAR